MQVNNPTNYASPSGQYYVKGVCIRFYNVPAGSVPILVTEEGLFEILSVENDDQIIQHTKIVTEKNDYFMAIDILPGYFIITFDQTYYCVVYFDSNHKFEVKGFEVGSTFENANIERIFINTIKDLYFDRTFDQIINHVDFKVNQKKFSQKLILEPTLA